MKRTDLEADEGGCNAIEGCWLDDQCCRLFQLFPPLFYVRLLSFNFCNLRPSLSTSYLHFLLPCSRGRRRSCNAVEILLASRSMFLSVPALSPLFSVRILSFNLCNLRPFLSTDYLHFLLPCFADFICRKGSNLEGSPYFFSCFSSLFSSLFSSFFLSIFLLFFCSPFLPPLGH